MGSAKDWMMKKEDCKRIAEEICVRAGVLGRCECCGGVYDSLAGDLVPAYKLGNYLITKNDPLVASLNGDRDLLSRFS